MALEMTIQKAFSGFSLNVSLRTDADRIGILGASGAGKSMLLQCISGLMRPDHGKIIIGDKILFDSESRINLQPRERRVGFLFQNYALFPHMTVLQNITFALDGQSHAQKADIAARLLEKFHLHDIETRYPSQISGGQQQRVAIARALAAEPEILLLDEPLSALDEHLREHMIMEMLEDLKDFKGSVLLVTHAIEEAYRLCSDLAILNRGRIESFGAKEKMFRFPETVESSRITGCRNLTAAQGRPDQTVVLPDWGIVLKTSLALDDFKGFAGIRGNHIRLAQAPYAENMFPVWIADQSETPFKITLYLKLAVPPENLRDYHLEWELSRESWQIIRTLPQPFHVHLPSEHVFFLKG